MIDQETIDNARRYVQIKQWIKENPKITKMLVTKLVMMDISNIDLDSLVDALDPSILAKQIISI